MIITDLCKYKHGVYWREGAYLKAYATQRTIPVGFVTAEPASVIWNDAAQKYYIVVKIKGWESDKIVRA